MTALLTESCFPDPDRAYRALIDDERRRTLENMRGVARSLDPAEAWEFLAERARESGDLGARLQNEALREARIGDGVRLIVNPRGGKVAAQNRAVRETDGEILAFSDANATWAPDALRRLVENLADPEVAYVCGQLRLEDAEGGNREGLYWRYEMALRSLESRLLSVTGGNGAIYATRREAYIEVDPIMGHDLSFPFNMVKRGWRAVYVPQARASEKMVPSIEGEFARKRRMMSHAWPIVVRGGLAVHPVIVSELHVASRGARASRGPGVASEGASVAAVSSGASEGGIVGMNHETGYVDNTLLLNRIAMPLTKGMLWFLQLARGFCAYANGGRLVTPRILKGVLDAEGNVISRNENKGLQLLPEAVDPITAAEIKRTLCDTVIRGTAQKARTRMRWLCVSESRL